MKIILGYTKPLDKRGNPMETYARSFHYYFKKAGHIVLPVGEGHSISDIDEIGDEWKEYDLWLDIDNGRNLKGELRFQYADQSRKNKVNIPSAVRFIDTHGYPSLHHRAARKYDHVFFAVWDKRDRFANHRSAHWCPNSSDDRWFDYVKYSINNRFSKFSVGFFGSKGGLERADILKTVCDRRNLNYDIREVGSENRQRWPSTAEAMAACRALFNYGQKHDGPNQRVIESMLMNKPLLNNKDDRDGMSKIFQENEHYLSYSNEVELGIVLDRALEDPHQLAQDMAERAYKLVKEKHLVKHRVEQILEVCQK